MAAMNGRHWRLFTKDPAGRWVPFAGARDESLTHNNQAIDRTDKEADGYRHLLENGGRSVDLSLSCVAMRGAGYDRLVQAVKMNSFMPLRAESFDSVLEGQFHVSNYRESGADAQAVNFSASFQSADRYKHLTTLQLVGEGFFAGQFTRNTTAPYYDSNGVERTAAIDEPRFDYHPDTGEYRGLLIEQQETVDGVTRAKDDARVIDLSPFNGFSEGTFVVEYETQAAPSSIDNRILSRGANARFLSLRGAQGAYSFDGNSVEIVGGGVSSGSHFYVLAFDDDTQSLCTNGGPVKTAAWNGTWGSGDLLIGEINWSGWIKSLRWIPRRVSDAELQRLTRID